MSNIPLKEAWFEFGMAVRLSSHYHQERRRFFERWNNLSAFLSVVLSSAAIASIKVNSQTFSIFLSLSVTVIQAANLIAGFSRKSWTHADLMKRFIDLEAEWRRSSENRDTLVTLQLKRLEIEKQEPTPMPYLVLRCQRDLMRRDGYPESEWPEITWWKRVLAQYLPEMG